MKMKEKSINKNALYHWLFRYNTYTKKWFAFRREDMTAYFNGTETKHKIYSDSDINKLVEIVKSKENE